MVLNSPIPLPPIPGVGQLATLISFLSGIGDNPGVRSLSWQYGSTYGSSYVDNPHLNSINSGNIDYSEYLAIVSDFQGDFGFFGAIDPTDPPGTDFLVNIVSACLSTGNNCDNTPFGYLITRTEPHTGLPGVTKEDMKIYLLRAKLEIQISNLYSLPGAATVVSNVEGDLSGGGDRLHTPTSPNQTYGVAYGQRNARIGVFDANGSLILGLRKTFTLNPKESKVWAPTATTSFTLKTNYNGPVEDCPRLEGTFNVDINGLYDGAFPNIPISNSNSAMVINNSTFNTIELQKPSNDPLQVTAKTLRSCNLAEGLHQLGWLLNYNFNSTTTTEGFYVKLQGPITNSDNRWPTFVWNLSNTDAPTGGQSCTGVTLNITASPQNYPGEVNQVFNNRVAGSRSRVLTRNNFVGNFYRFTFVDTDPDLTFNGTFDATGPGFVDSKFTFRGVAAWKHHVIFRDPSDSECGANLQAPTNVNSTETFLNWQEFTAPQQEFSVPDIRPKF